MIKTINYKNHVYPKFQSEGYAAQFVIPFASKVCIGKGYDIGCKKIEWAFKGAIPIDIIFKDGYHALNLPEKNVDYVFSSHCLEHIDADWVDVLDYWTDVLKIRGTLFLYLPDFSQVYWRPFNNRKHKHIFTNQILYEYMKDRKYKNIFYSERDLNNSFTIMGEKSEDRISYYNL